MKYPPVMLAVKNPENCNVSYYKGFGAAFIYYFAEHLQLRYKLAILFFFIIRKQKSITAFWYVESLEFVPEKPSEVAKKGQLVAAMDAVTKKESFWAYNFS